MARKVGSYIRRNHLGLVAVFIAFGGTAWAAATVGPSDIDRNAVRSKHIKAKQVRPGDVSPKLRDGCPEGTGRLGPICVRFQGSNLNWFDAQSECGQRNLRTPTVGEAKALGENHDVPGIGASDTYWTDELAEPDQAIVGTESGFGSTSALANLHEVICVTEPRQGA